MIDAYITELGNALRGPMRAKHDLLAEARDSLIDATEAYQQGGADGPPPSGRPPETLVRCSRSHPATRPSSAWLRAGGRRS